MELRLQPTAFETGRLDYQVGPNIITRVKEGGRRVRVRKRLDRTLLALKMVGGHEPRTRVDLSRRQKRQKSSFSAGAYNKEHSSDDSFQTSDLQNCRIINLCCLKIVSLWYFVTAAVGNKYNMRMRFRIQDNYINGLYKHIYKGESHIHVVSTQ